MELLIRHSARTNFNVGLNQDHPLADLFPVDIHVSLLKARILLSTSHSKCNENFLEAYFLEKQPEVGSPWNFERDRKDWDFDRLSK